MAVLLASLLVEAPGATINRLCGSGLNAIALAVQAIATGKANLIIAHQAKELEKEMLAAPTRRGVQSAANQQRHFLKKSTNMTTHSNISKLERQWQKMKRHFHLSDLLPPNQATETLQAQGTLWHFGTLL